MSISWFPGHMAKTRRMIAEYIKQVDIVLELCDARVPRSSRNPELAELLAGKPSLLLLNKSDISDPAENDRWLSYFKAGGQPAMLCDSLLGRGVERIAPLVKDILKDKIARNLEKGQNRPIKIMIVGVPNVGKSSLINRLSGKKSAKVEDRPGVTRDKQWIMAKDGLQLLDTPGILWPKFENEEIGLNLAAASAVKDQITDPEEVASYLLSKLKSLYPLQLINRYNIEISDGDSGFDILTKIGKRRGFLIRGGEIDTERAAKIVLDEFRSAVIGRITLERI